MALFQKRSKMEKLEVILAALRKRAALLADKRTSAQAALDAAIVARQETLISGDLDDGARLLKMQNAVDSAASTLAGLDGAISALRIQIADADAQLNAEAERGRREVASEEIAKNVAEVERLIGPWLAASRQIAAAFAKLDHVFEAGQIGGFISGCAGEVEVAAAVTLVELRDLPKLVAAGDRPIPHRPEAVLPVAVVRPALTQLFSLHAIQWTDEHGMLRRLGKWHDVELPQEAAERALRLGFCAPMSDPRRKNLVGQGHGHPDPHWCKDLDNELTPDADVHQPEAIQHSAFEKPVIGEARILKIAR
jgi:hypothetical protein